jgi:hypothetical protein
MALGALTLGNDNVGFDATGTSMVPVSSGDNKVGKIEIKSPFETFKDTFTSMQESLGAMVGIQTKEAKRQEIIDKKLIEQRDFEIKMMNEKFADSGAAGAPMPDSNDDLAGVDTDDKTYGNFVEKAENVSGNILDTIKEAFGNVSFGPKMTAILFAGGLVFFMKYKEQLVKVLTPIVQFVKDMIDTFGPGKVFAAFIGGFLLLKSGLAKKGIMKAGSLILKGIKASAAAIDKQGGLVKAVGNGFEKINRGMTSIVGGAKKTGTFITKNLTKGFDKLGSGVKAMNRGVGSAASKLGGGFSKLFGLIGKGFMLMKVGMMSMLSSITPMIAPLLPVIAIAAGIAAVLYSLKSGFDTFKASLDQGDSLIVAIIKGVSDAMLTLVLLPVTLIKKLVGFIAGLFGFDNFKEKLESFSIKDAIVNTFKKLTGGMFKLIKAIAKGVVAALAAALPGGKTPQEEFSRAYAEVMKGGEGKANVETQEMKGGESSVADKQFMDQDNNEVSAFGVLRAKVLKFKSARDKKFKNMFGMGETDELGVPKKLEVGESMTSTTMKTETIKKEGKVVSSKQDVVVVKGGDVKQGDTINQMSQTNISGDLEVNNQERTQRSIQEMF